MANYHRGRRKEWELRDLLRKRGLGAERNAGSHGMFDVYAWGTRCWAVFQVKYQKRERSMTSWLRDPEIKKFRRAVFPRGTKKYLAVYTYGRKDPEILRL